MLAALRLLLVLGLVGCDGGVAVMRFFGWVGCYLQVFFRWEFARGLDRRHPCRCRREARINRPVEIIYEQRVQIVHLRPPHCHPILVGLFLELGAVV